MIKAENIKKSFGNISDLSKKIGTGMTVMGAAIVGSMTAATVAYADAGDEIQRWRSAQGFRLNRFRN